ncbi:MAG: helix-turn-helix domain-containing protein [Cellulomonadaceae bacterium]
MSPQPPGRDAAAWRRSIGHVLREVRRARGQRLTDVAQCAGVSPQYLSEVERGRKEPSSEVLAAVTAALDLSLGDLARHLARGLEVVDLASVRDAGVRSSGEITLLAA